MNFNCRLAKMVFVAAVFGLLVSYGWGTGAFDSGQPLTVEETVGAVFLRPMEGTTFNLYKNANRDAKKVLYDILENKNLEDHHAAALLVLGYIGDATDVKNMEREALNRYTGLMTPSQRKAMVATYDCLGLMASRGVDEAALALKKMATLEYWEGARFQWFPDNVLTNKPGLEYEGLAWVLRAYGLSGKGDLKQIVQTLLERIPSAKAREFMTGRIDPKRLAMEVEFVRRAEKEPVSQQLREIALKTYTERASEIYSDVKQAVKLTQDERDFLKNTIKEAQDQLEKIKAAILKGSYGELSGHLLDNGQKIDQDKIKRLWAQYEKDLSREQQVFESLAERKASPFNFSVEKTMSYQLPHIDDKNGTELKADKREVVTVTFAMKDSTEIGNVLFPRLKGSLSVAKDGSLMVIMKKIDGEWYWNPFGW